MKLSEPCMSCGKNRYEPPPVGCLHTRNHPLPEEHQVWVLLRGPDGDRYEIRGTGAL